MVSIEVVGQARVRGWGLLAVVYFALSGAAAGCIAFCLLAGAASGGATGLLASPNFLLLPIVMLTAGFLIISAEAKRPLRSVFLLNNVRSSWMSREILAGVLLIGSSALSCLYPSLILRFLALLSAVLFLFSQGMVVYGSRALASWNRRPVPELFLSSGFAMGFGLYVVSGALAGVPLDRTTLALGLATLTLDLWLWLTYLFPRRDEHFLAATKALRSAAYLTSIIGIGHLLPALILMLLIIPIPAGETARLLSWLAGVLVIAGGVYLKTGILLRANYFRPISAAITGDVRRIDALSNK